MALKFNGTTDYISVGTLGNFGSLLNNGSTFSFWIKTNTTSTIRTILGLFNTGTTVGISLDLNRDQNLAAAVGKTSFFIRDNGGLVLNGCIATNIYNNVWHHIVWKLTKLSDDIMEVYVDGQLVELTVGTSANPASFVNFGFPLTIGALNNRATIAQFADCSIDDVLIYNRSVSNSEILNIYNSRKKGIIIPNGCIAYWPMNEGINNSSGTGKQIFDRSNNGNIGFGVGSTFISSELLSYE